jgi:hypothetical protein
MVKIEKHQRFINTVHLEVKVENDGYKTLNVTTWITPTGKVVASITVEKDEEQILATDDLQIALDKYNSI